MAGKPFFSAVHNEYKRFPPLQFRQTGPDYHDTCAVRLADAITRVQPDFFAGAKIERWPEKIPTGHYVPSADRTVGLRFEPAPRKRSLPIRAGEIKDYLNSKFGVGRVIKSGSEISGLRGIICFEHIPGYSGTGHISLWDGQAVVDQGEYWGSTRVWFWSLP